jgi:hypothetical protein
MRSPRLAAFVVALAAAFVATARASIEPPPAPHEIAARADVVFVGTVQSVGKETMRVAVGEVLKGEPEKTVDVEPIFQVSCQYVPDDERTPMFAVGDRIVVAAKRGASAYEIIGGADLARPQKTDADLAHQTAFHREMLRIVALPDVVDRRAAMVKLMSSKDASLAYAARQFQYSQILSADDARPHVAGLVAALSAPQRDGRWAAMYSLHGLTPPEALDRLIELTKSPERDDADKACDALAPYDDKRAVDALLAAIDDAKRGAGFGIEHLGKSPRPEARARLGAALKSEDPSIRKEGFHGFLFRVRKSGATDADVDEVLAALRRDITRDESHLASLVVAAARSPRLDEAVVALVGDAKSTAPQRHAAYMAFTYATRTLKRTDVPALLLKHQAVFIARADGDETETTLFDVLDIVHTTECRAALERAARTWPDKSARDEAQRLLEKWDAK